MAAASPAFAAEAKIKIIAENDKLQVMDVVQNPGDTGAMESRLGVVVPALDHRGQEASQPADLRPDRDLSGRRSLALLAIPRT